MDPEGRRRNGWRVNQWRVVGGGEWWQKKGNKEIESAQNKELRKEMRKEGKRTKASVSRIRQNDQNRRARKPSKTT